MASFREVLSPLQERLLQAFSGRDDVWLTGGLALGAFHLGHRRSEDLDWFTARADRLEPLARHLGAFSAALRRRSRAFSRRRAAVGSGFCTTTREA